MIAEVYTAGDYVLAGLAVVPFLILAGIGVVAILLLGRAGGWWRW